MPLISPSSASKSDKHDPAGLTEVLDRGLKRMGTDYFDLYYMHALKDPNSITPELGKKVEVFNRLSAPDRVRYVMKLSEEERRDFVKAQVLMMEQGFAQ